MLETAIPYGNNRNLPTAQIGPFMEVMADSGVVDAFWAWDELTSWFPKHLWTQEHTGFADMLPLHSTNDPFLLAAMAMQAQPGMGVHLSTDAVRARPAELMRTLMTLASASQRRPVLAIGAGELRQAKPFGYLRKEGLGRLEDILKLAKLLWERDEPFDFEGNYWTLKKATLGSVRPERRPELWALGGGPKLLEMAAQYADGFETNAPVGTLDPETWAVQVKSMKDRVEAHGRDPEKFGFGVWFGTFMHDDPEVLKRAFDNPLMKFFAPLFGRSSQSAWRREGLEPVMPLDYNYAVKFNPFEMTDKEAQDIVDRVPSKMVEKAMHVGTPAECAAIARQYVEAGATFVGLVDVLPLVLGPAEAEAAGTRALEFMRHLKA